MKWHFVILLLILNACRNKQETDAGTIDSAGIDHKNSATPPAKSALREVVSAYLEIKNALANDNGTEAAESGKRLRQAIEKVNSKTFTQEQVSVFEEQKEEIMGNSEHIGDNADNIDHQRSHFDLLSDAMYAVVKAIPGTHVRLYKMFCSKLNNNAGAIWLSESPEISNPYFGKTVPACGEVKEELK